MTVKIGLAEIIKEEIKILPIEENGLGRPFYENTWISIRSYVVDDCRFRLLGNFQREQRVKTSSDKARKSAK